CPAQSHQIVDIVARIEYQTTDGAVGYNFAGQCYGTQMQPHEFGHILHAIVHRQPEATENVLHPPRTERIVAVEGPSLTRIEFLSRWFGNVVEQGRPTKPQILGVRRN